jgi:hypothetical protein
VVGLISAGLLEVHTGGHEEFYTLA